MEDQVCSNHLTSTSTQADSQGPGGFYLSAPRTNAFDGDVESTYAACTGNPIGDPNRTATIIFTAIGLDIDITEKVGLIMSANQDVEVVTSDGTFTLDTPELVSQILLKLPALALFKQLK